MFDLNRERARPTRRRLIGSGLLLAGTWMAACAPGQPGGWRPAAGAPEAGTISYAIWDTPGSAERLKQRIDEFQSNHAGAQIDLMSWDYNTYLDKLQVTYASDSGPDAVNLDMPIVQKYAKMGVLVDQRPPGPSAIASCRSRPRETGAS